MITPETPTAAANVRPIPGNAVAPDDVVAGLTHALHDSIETLEVAASNAEDGDVSTRFATMAEDRRSVVDDFVRVVVDAGFANALGAADGTFIGRVRRSFASTWSSVTGDQALVGAVEAAEEKTRAAIDEALQHELPATVRSAVLEVRESVQKQSTFSPTA